LVFGQSEYSKTRNNRRKRYRIARARIGALGANFRSSRRRRELRSRVLASDAAPKCRIRFPRASLPCVDDRSRERKEMKERKERKRIYVAKLQRGREGSRNQRLRSAPLRSARARNVRWPDARLAGVYARISSERFSSTMTVNNPIATLRRSSR